MQKFFRDCDLPVYFCKQASKKNASEWISLLMGTPMATYNGDKMPLDIRHVLTFTTDQIMEEDYDYKGSRDIIYGASEFDNFELS